MSPIWGSTPRLTDWLIVSRNVTLTWLWLLLLFSSSDLSRYPLIYHTLSQFRCGTVDTFSMIHSAL
jgi:hypothetical protein